MVAQSAGASRADTRRAKSTRKAKSVSRADTKRAQSVIRTGTRRAQSASIVNVQDAINIYLE